MKQLGKMGKKRSIPKKTSENPNFQKKPNCTCSLAAADEETGSAWGTEMMSSYFFCQKQKISGTLFVSGPRRRRSETSQ
jgi:hypothetical protein